MIKSAEERLAEIVKNQQDFNEIVSAVENKLNKELSSLNKTITIYYTEAAARIWEQLFYAYGDRGFYVTLEKDENGMKAIIGLPQIEGLPDPATV
jgi:hypothetical protein